MTVPLPPVEPEAAARLREQIVISSRERYAARREDVEAILHASHAPQTATIRIPVPLPPTKKSSRATSEVQPPIDEISTPGRGGEHHKYLQTLIKRWAEARGFE